MVRSKASAKFSLAEEKVTSRFGRHRWWTTRARVREMQGGGGARHFISQDAVDAVVVQVDEPIEALHLVLSHDAMLDDAGLLAEAVAHMVAATNFILEQVGILLLLCVLGSVPAPALPAQASRRIRDQWELSLSHGKQGMVGRNF